MPHSLLKLSRKNLLHNFNYLKSKVSQSTKSLVLVKANGYGHGDIEISTMAQEFGADYLGVAYPNEGIRLKKAGIKIPIIVLTPGYNNFEDIVEYGLQPSIINIDELENLKKVLIDKKIDHFPVNIKCDTGMNRVGFTKKEISKLKEALYNNHIFRVNSIFSHLAAADDNVHDNFTLSQIELFEEMYNDICSVINYKPIKHILNSWGIERFPEYHFDMVRMGIALYGSQSVAGNNLLPVATLDAPIVHIKEVSEGTVGYGRWGELNGKIKTIASIPLGYADGIDRHLGRGKASFMINGKMAPTIGNICMDMFMMDITGIDAKCGDRVTIFGERPTADDLADTLTTISYEILTSVSQRVQRVIVD